MKRSRSVDSFGYQTYAQTPPERKDIDLQSQCLNIKTPGPKGIRIPNHCKSVSTSERPFVVEKQSF